MTFDRIGKIISGFVCGVLLTYGGIVACQTKPAVMTPNEVQMLRLQLKLKDAQMAKAAFNASYAALMDQANQTKKENNWPDTTLFDPDRLTFSAPPAPVPPVKK